MKWITSAIEFQAGTRKVTFTIAHNMPGEKIEPALYSWLARTKVYTNQSFVDYINSKDIYQAMTMEQFTELNKIES